MWRYRARRKTALGQYQTLRGTRVAAPSARLEKISSHRLGHQKALLLPRSPNACAAVYIMTIK